MCFRFQPEVGKLCNGCYNFLQKSTGLNKWLPKIYKIYFERAGKDKVMYIYENEVKDA